MSNTYDSSFKLIGPLLDVVSVVALDEEEFDEVEAFRTAGLGVWTGVIC